MKKEYRMISLGQLAVLLKFNKRFLALATEYYKEQLENGREVPIEELLQITKKAFPGLIISPYL